MVSMVVWSFTSNDQQLQIVNAKGTKVASFRNRIDA